MPSSRRGVISAPKSKEIEKDKRKLNEKLKRDKTVLEKRIAEQTKEFESERRLTEKRLKLWMDPNNCGVFERKLRRLAEREAKAIDCRISNKVKSIVEERRYLQSRLVCFRKQNVEDCMKNNDAQIRDLLKDLQCDPDSRRSKKKQRIPCGVG